MDLKIFLIQMKLNVQNMFLIQMIVESLKIQNEISFSYFKIYKVYLIQYFDLFCQKQVYNINFYLSERRTKSRFK